MLMTRVKKACNVWKNDGKDVFFYKVKQKLDSKNIFRASLYEKWVEANERDILEVTEL